MNHSQVEATLGEDFIETEDRMLDEATAEYLRMQPRNLFAWALDDPAEPYNMIFLHACRRFKDKAGFMFLVDGGF